MTIKHGTRIAQLIYHKATIPTIKSKRFHTQDNAVLTLLFTAKTTLPPTSPTTNSSTDVVQDKNIILYNDDEVMPPLIPKNVDSGDESSTASKIFWAMSAEKGHIMVRADASNVFVKAPAPKAPLYLRLDTKFDTW